MSDGLPQVSGQNLVRLLERLGYEVVRQKGSHVRLTKLTSSGQHHLSVPAHRVIAKGTLNDLLSVVSVRIGVPKEDLIAELR